jgi:MFS family permease
VSWSKKDSTRRRPSRWRRQVAREVGAAENGQGTIASIIAYFRESFSSRHYVLIYVATTLAALAFAPVNSFAVLYARSIGLGMERYGKYLALTYVISFVLSYPLGALADRLHPLRVGIATLLIYAAVALWGGIFAHTPATFALAFVGHGVVSGAFYTVQVPIYQRLLPASKFGQFYSAANLLVGLGFVVLPAVVGLLLDATGNVYRYTFLSGGLLALAAFASLIVVYVRFMRMGGPKGYVAPE